jgi:DNA repair exonuclease SbcCD ATPase subunit
MKIQSIEFKNFASYGNLIQKLEFEDDSSELFLTLGKNGHGKTTIANAIVYALYGKVEGVKMADLPNRINKELWVKINLQCGTTEVSIERGLAPSKFEVRLNGVEFDKAGKRSVQEYLEEEIFGIPYHVFKNIIILSVNDFKSFLTMTNHDKKQIIDRMFGFSILNEMQRQIKEERKGLKVDIDVYERELKSINENITSVNMQLNELMAESNEKDKVKIQELKDTLIRYSGNKNKLAEAQKNITESVKNIKTNLTDARSEKTSLEFELQSLKGKLKLYESNTCPTCEGPLEGEFHTDRKAEMETKANELPSQIKDATIKLKSINDSIESFRSKDLLIRDKVSSINTNINNLKKELLKIKDSLAKGSDFSHMKQLISNFETQETEKIDAKSKVNADYYFLENLEEILGEDGVKNLAVKTILPGLNTNIAAMIQTMHLPFHIRFDEKFDCIINHLGEEINPMTLSTGERKKADFIIIIAIIKILKLRFPQLNLLFLDELLSSVDADGVHNILKILSKVIKEAKLNTFIINHSVLPREVFDKEIHIFKENGFSKFEVTKVD